jgi:tetratricopeptide (TPR) repeat protein
VRLFREAQTRLLREAQAMAQLAHPNVIAVHDMGTVGEGVFFAMERVEGGTLRDWLHSPRSWREVVALFLQAGGGLAAAHAAGIVHRDFKPENLLVGVDGRVRVTDFGVARALAAAPEGGGPAPTGPRLLSAELTSSGQVVGTPGYLAPEQLDGLATAQSDQFAFAVTLYEALIGKRPFTLDEAYAREHAGTAATFPPGTKLPGYVREAVLRGLEKDPARRFPSLEAMLAALERDPRARRLRLVAAGVALGALALVGGRALVLRASHEQACAELSASAARSWARSRPAIADAFPRTGKAYAAQALSVVTTTLGAFAGEWGAARGAVCLGKGDLPEPSRPLAAACLDEAAQTMDATTLLMAQGDPVVVERASEMMAALPSVRDCLDRDALRTAPAPPGPKVAALVAGVRVRLARAEALAIPHPDRGLVAMRPLVAELEPAHYPAALAEIYFLIGESETRADRVPEAEAALQQAAELALASNHDRLFIRAASRLAFVLGGYDKQRDRALDWLRLANQAFDRAGRPPALEGWLALQETGVFLGAGRYDECARAAGRAVDGMRRQGDRFHEAEAAFLVAECRSYSVSVEEALQDSERVLALHLATFGPDHPNTGTALSGVAYGRWLAGDFAGGLSLEERGDVIAEAIGSPTLELAMSHEYRAKLLEGLGRDREALVDRRRALEILGKVPHRAISDADVLAGLASSERKTGQPAEALAHARAAVAACTEEVERGWPHRCAPAHFVYAQVLAGRGERAEAAQQGARARAGWSLHPAERRLRDEVDSWAAATKISLPAGGAR